MKVNEENIKNKRNPRQLERVKKYKTYKNQLESTVDHLRKYPFIEKMFLCQKYSTRMMKYTHLDILNTPNPVYPWELEAFAELSLFSEASDATHSFQTSDSDFIDIINIIRNYRHPYLKKQKNLEFVSNLIMAVGLQQFKAQEHILDRLYRYDYFWNFTNEEIDMPKEFSQHFGGLKFSDFKDLGILIFFYASVQQDTSDIIKALTLKYKEVVDYLKITRLEYQKKQIDKLDENYQNTIFGFNYLHPFPFVEFKNFLFLPLPYLIIDAVTESLLTRITVDNNLLREKIGKEVAQKYIEKIFKEGNVYDEVLPEHKYIIGKKRIDSPDILIRQGNKVCFIDTKLSTPSLELRKFNNEAVKKTVSRYAENVIQVYNRINEFNDGHYYPFREKLVIEKSDVYGIVAVIEDSYILRGQIYTEVFIHLGIEKDSKEAEYIQTNIKFTNFRDLENFAFRLHDIFVALSKKKEDPKTWNDLMLFDKQFYKDSSYRILPSVKDFEEMSQRTILNTIDEFVHFGLIANDDS